MTLKGQRLAVTFLDHCKGDDVIKFTIMGMCTCDSPRMLKLSVWYYTDDALTVDENVEEFAIVRSAVERIEVL